MTELPTVDEWRLRGETVELLGHSIFVADSATSKPPLLLLHGFPTSSWDWVDIWPMLEIDYRLIAPDFLGFGLSAKPHPHRYSIMEQADLVEALLRHLEIDTLHVIAHDYGDTVAQELLARQNAGEGEGQWQTISFLNGGLFPETHHRRFIQSLLSSPVGPWLVPFMGRGTFRRNMTRVFGKRTPPSPQHVDSMWTLLHRNRGRRVIPKLLGYMRDREEHRERWVGALQNSRIPIAIVNGPDDPVSGAHMVNRFRELVPGDHFIESLHGIGHYPQSEAPASVVRAWARFIADCDEAEKARRAAAERPDAADTVLIDMASSP